MADSRLYTPEADANEGPRGINSVLPGVHADAGSTDPASTTIGGAVANAMAYTAEWRGDAEQPAGSGYADPINLPNKGY